MMETPSGHFSSNGNIAPTTKTQLTPRDEPARLVTAALVAFPVVLAVILLTCFMLLPKISPKVHIISTKCILSAEANSSGLSKFFRKVQDVYFKELHPENIALRPGVTTAEVRNIFWPYDPKPSSIKRRTQLRKKLLQELERIKYNETNLKLRERCAYYIARNFLRDGFGGEPFGRSYDVADWMMGPDYYCQQPICNLVSQLAAALPHFAPGNWSDAQKLRKMLKAHNNTVEQYIANLNIGVKAGMIRSRDACNYGIHSMKYEKYEVITLKKEEGEI